MIKNIINYLNYTNKYYATIISILLLFLSETLVSTEQIYQRNDHLFRKRPSYEYDDEGVSQKIIKSNSIHAYEQFEDVDDEKSLPPGFEYVEGLNSRGPITIDRKKDDGNKRNLYPLIHDEEEDLFQYQYTLFKELPSVLYNKTEYLCELNTNRAPEIQKGYDISCPSHYTLSINKVFYGHYANDTDHCHKKTKAGYQQNVPYDCGYEPKKYIKELCEGRVYCSIIPSDLFLENRCHDIIKYLHINYSCVKAKELKKEKIGIVMFSNQIEANSLDENSISEFYQYSKIHGYDFQLSTYNYNPERKIYYMKLYTLMEKMIEGLKEKKYDWIFWVDSDTILVNPNITLESFLPNEDMNRVHLIAANDWKQIQAGVLLIRVHPWSLDLLIRALSYSYYDGEVLSLWDQTALNNVLTRFDESEHYIIVPPNWFNAYLSNIKEGDFLLHLAGDEDKKSGKYFRKKIKNNNQWTLKTNNEMREEVLKYYSLPEERQRHISVL